MGVKAALSSLSIIVLFATGCELEEVQRDPAAQEAAVAAESQSGGAEAAEQPQPAASSDDEGAASPAEQVDGESANDASEADQANGTGDSDGTDSTASSDGTDSSDSDAAAPALPAPAIPAPAQPDNGQPDNGQSDSGEPESARPGEGQSATPGNPVVTVPGDVPRPVLPAPDEIPKQPDRPVTPAPPDNPQPNPPAPDPQPDPPAPDPQPDPPAPDPQPDPPAPDPQPDPPAPNPPAPLPDGNLRFSEDFRSGDWRSTMAVGLFHRDDHVVAQGSWFGDHQSTGPNDLCGAPTEKRVVERGDRSNNFNEDWIYRCVPGGDLAKAHMMTTIGDTSGYSIGAFAPTATFNNVTEVRWDVNQTDLGDRQFTEIAIIPTGRFDFENLPCTDDVPCDTTSHADLGSVGTQWAGTRVRKINTFDEPNGYMQASGPLGYRCDSCPYAGSRGFGRDYGVGDPALTSIKIRRQNFFRDNGNGTLTWGFQLEDGSFDEFTAPGSFPRGQVRVVFKDHNYTPLKSPATLNSETTFTWHWDNIQVFAS